MKKFSKYILAALAALPMLAGCNIAEFGDQHIYNPGEPDVDGCYGVYFPSQEASGSHLYDPADKRTITITAMRTNTVGDITVPVVVSGNEDNVFSIGEISFLDGAEETSFNVDFEDAEIATQYNITLQVVDKKYASSYTQNATSIDFSIMIVKWEKFFGPGATEETSKGHFTQVCWQEEYDCDMYYYDTPYANIRSCKLENGWHGNTATVDCVFYWDIKTNYVYVPHQWMGYINSSGKYVYAADTPGFYNAYYNWGVVCPSEEYFTWEPKWIASYGYPQPAYDGNGCFYLGGATYSCTADGTPTGSGYQFDASSLADLDYFIAAGFDRSDFEIKKIESDYSVDGATPVYFQVGKTTAAAKYAIVKGELTATTASYVVEEIVAGTKGTIYTDFTPDVDENYNDVLAGALSLELEETSEYTIVLVTFADAECTKDNAKANDFLVFQHVAKGDVEEYAVDITLGAEETSSRYTEYTPVNSFQCYIVGSDITKACATVYTTEYYEAKEEAIKAYVKAGCPDDDGNTYYFDDDSIDMINEEGGYGTIISDLSPLTSYTVVLWATNDMEDVIKTVEWTTDGFPREKISSGTYTLNAFYEGAASGVLWYDPNYSMNVIEYYMGEFYFSVDGETSKITIPTPQSLPADSYGSYKVGEVWEMMEYLYGDNAETAAAYYETNYGMQIRSIKGTSNYNSGTGVYSFALFYKCTAGYIGSGVETYVADSQTGALKKTSSKLKMFKIYKPGLRVMKNTSESVFNFSDAKPVVRIPQTIDVKATSIPCKPNFSVKSSSKPEERSAEIKSLAK